MPYRAAYMRGDYRVRYRGDPGIFSFLGGVGKAIVGGATGAVRSLVTGGNPIAGAIAGATSAVAGPKPPAAITPSFSISPGSANIPQISPLTPGTQIVTAGGGMVGMSPLGTVGATSGRGMHPNRSGYWTRAGFVAKGTKLVRNRHANYGNGRALKRALRRAHGFQHLARAVMSFTLTGKKHGRAHFKTTRKAR